MKKDFIPVRIGDIDIWENTFLKALQTHSGTLGLNPDQVLAVGQKVDAHRTAYSEAQAAKKFSKSKVSIMQDKKAKALKAVRNLTRQIKASPGYTDGVGRAFGIIGPEDSKELTEPKLKARSIGGRAVISYKKYRSHGIYLYGRRGSETTLTLLAADNRSPYVDTRPNLDPSEPEQREYAAYYMLNDEPVGKMGSIVRLLVPAEGY